MSDFLMIGGTRVPIAAPSGADEEYQEIGGEMVRSFSGRLLSTVKGRARVWRLQTPPLPDSEAQLLAAALTGGVPLACLGELIGGEALCYARSVRTRPAPRGYRSVEFELHEAAAPRPRLLFRWSARHPYPVWQHSRASEGTYRDRFGVIQIAGPDVLRITWQGGRPYMLVEPASQNLVPHGDDLTKWDKSTAATITAEAGVWRLAPTGPVTNQVVAVASTAGVEQGAEVVVYAELKRGNHDRVGVSLNGITTLTSQHVVVDMQTRTVVTQGAAVGWVRIDDLDDGWIGVAVYYPDVQGGPTARHASVRLVSGTGQTLTGTGDEYVLIRRVWCEPGSIVTSYIPTAEQAASRAQDLVQANWSHGVVSCTVLMAGISAGGDQGMIGTAGARLFQLGAGASVLDRAFVIRAFPADGVAATLGNGSAAVNSTGSAIPIGYEYIRAGVLEIDTVARTGRVRLLQRYRQTPGDAWVDASGPWSPSLDVTPLLREGWQQPAITVGNVYSGSRPGRMMLSDLAVLDITGLDASRITIDDVARVLM